MRTARDSKSPAFASAWHWGWVRDVVAAAAVFVTTFMPLILFADGLGLLSYAIVGLPVVLMFARRRFPWVVLPACVACFVAAPFTLDLTPYSALPTGIAVFTIATRSTRRTVLITVLCVLAVMIPVALPHERAGLRPLTVTVIVMVGFFAAAGDAIRSRRAYIDEITQRAVQAEQTREAEASRRVAEDRLRIARDLHDAVAHQISVINLHAGVAGRAVDDDPETAKAAMTTVGVAARRVLGEIGDLLATLRASGEPQPVAPTPGLEQLRTLFDEFEASGLRVTSRLDGELDHLPAAVDLAAYRVIQEALTNAQKHGSVPRAHVWIDRDEARLRLVITNPVEAAPARPAPPGNGLLGIEERVASVGGRVDVGRDGATFRVQADLPLRADTPEGSA